MRTVVGSQAKASYYAYTMRLEDGRTVAVDIPAKWVQRDARGAVYFKPDAVRFLDRLRALFMPLMRPLTPGFVKTLRESLGMTQTEFGKSVHVDKLTVSRWERGELEPGKRSTLAILRLRKRSVRQGVAIPSQSHN